MTDQTNKPSSFPLWLVLSTFTIVLLMAVYGFLGAFVDNRGGEFLNNLDRYEEQLGELDPAGRLAIELLRRTNAKPEVTFLESNFDWVLAWYAAEPFGASLFISLGLIAVVGLFLLPFFVWTINQRLAALVVTQEAVLKVVAERGSSAPPEK